jgi:hypothetical protein
VAAPADVAWQFLQALYDADAAATVRLLQGQKPLMLQCMQACQSYVEGMPAGTSQDCNTLVRILPPCIPPASPVASVLVALQPVSATPRLVRPRDL